MAHHFKVLFHLHDKVDALDFVGPLEMLSHVKNPDGSQVFDCSVASAHEITTSTQLARFVRDIDIATAYESLSTYDIFMVPGGAALDVLASKAEPLGLVRMFSALPGGRSKRHLFSVCTGSLFLASQGILNGLTGTTHWGSLDILRNITKDVAGEASVAAARVVEDRFVVNPMNQRGLRVITSGGISCGLDATLWLIEDLVGPAARIWCAKNTQYKYRGDEGLIVT